MSDFSEELKLFADEINKQKYDYYRKKIYKFLLPIAMIERGIDNWHKPIYAKELSKFFYRFYNDNPKIFDINFKDQKTGECLKPGMYNETKVMGIIKDGPLKHWTSINGFGDFVKNENGKHIGFFLNLKDSMKNNKLVMDTIKEICLTKIKDVLKDSINFEELDINTKFNKYEEFEKVKEILNSIDDPTTKREVITRKGQGKWRNRLLENTGECKLCKIQNSSVLIASHIKPFSKCDNGEHFDLSNGLILCANHDALFDKGLITFDSDGSIKISENVKHHPSDLEMLLLDDNIKIDLTDEQKNYLIFHRTQIFKI